MEAVLIALITALGGSGGIAVIWRAVLDSKDNRAAREDDLSERFSKRLEDRLRDMESRNCDLEDELEEERNYTLILCVLLARNGIDIPERKKIIND